MQKESEFRHERLSQSFKPGAESVFILRLCGHTHRKWFGVAFLINRDCFDGRDALLYIKGDIYPKLRDEIEKYSSGLTQVSIHTQDEIRFRLDHTKIKENISVNGGKLISVSEYDAR